MIIFHIDYFFSIQIIQMSKPSIENSSPAPFENLIQLKFDLSVFQQPLCQALNNLASRMSALEKNNTELQKTLHKEISTVYVRIQEESHQVGVKNSNLEARLQSQISQLKNLLAKNDSMSNPLSENFTQISKTPEEQEKSQYRKKENEEEKTQQKGEKKMENKNAGVSKTKEGQNQLNSKLSQIEKKCSQIYIQLRQQLEIEIKKTQKSLQEELDALKIAYKLQKFPKTEKSLKNNNLEYTEKGQILSIKSVHGDQDEKKEVQKSDSLFSDANILMSAKSVKEEKSRAGSSKKNSEKSQPQTIEKYNLEQIVEDLRRELKEEVRRNSEGTQMKLDQVSKTNSLLADHILQLKKSLQELSNCTDSMKMEVNSYREKGDGSEKQLSVILSVTTEHKNKIKSLENMLAKSQEDLKGMRERQPIMEEGSKLQIEQARQSSRRDVFRDTNLSLRSSNANLPVPRNTNPLKNTNNKIELIEDAMKKMNAKLTGAVERLNKMEDQRKKWGMGGEGLLPKIDNKQNKANNVNVFEMMKKDIKKVNEDLMKTNEKLLSTKEKLGQLYDAHAEIPNKIQDIYVKLRENNELQEDRLIELIKQLINRMLTDPFDNNFTNRLKRQINVKFLEIKHEYHIILKEIQGKVEDRAEKSELAYFKNSVDETILEIKAIANKKCDSEDFKKGMKYIESKVKEVFNFTKNQTTVLHNEQKQYLGGKKQLGSRKDTAGNLN